MKTFTTYAEAETLRRKLSNNEAHEGFFAVSIANGELEPIYTVGEYDLKTGAIKRYV